MQFDLYILTTVNQLHFPMHFQLFIIEHSSKCVSNKGTDLIQFPVAFDFCEF